MNSTIPFTSRSIETTKINLKDQPYIIQYPFPDLSANTYQPELTKSIRRYGLLSPIMVQKTKKDNLCIVHGANRFLACQSLGWSSIPSFIIPHHMKEFEVYQLSLSLFLCHKTPNCMEQAKIIQKLLDFFPKEKIIREYLPRLGLPPSDKIFSRIKQLTGLEEDIAQDLASDKINLELSLRLLKLASSERIIVHRFLRQLPFTLSQQFEVLEYLQEIALRDQIPIQKIVTDSSINTLLAQDLDQRQKIHSVRIYLRKRRYPRLTYLENTFSQEKKALQLPDNLELYAPPNFEHGNYKFELKFADFSEFEQKIDILHKLSKNQKFHSIIKS